MIGRRRSPTLSGEPDSQERRAQTRRATMRFIGVVTAICCLTGMAVGKGIGWLIRLSLGI